MKTDSIKNLSPESLIKKNFENNRQFYNELKDLNGKKQNPVIKFLKYFWGPFDMDDQDKFFLNNA